jgi:hypothetical protein
MGIAGEGEGRERIRTIADEGCNSGGVRVAEMKCAELRDISLAVREKSYSRFHCQNYRRMERV